jgi:NAD(P)-dependent dehydrogenase (short-subunit alcohol dehydrogenase family)
VDASHGIPDLIINNAAIMNTPANLWEVPTKEFHQLIDVNVKGVYNVIRAFVPAMVKRGTGTIVNLSSGWGVSTSPQVAPYCASKYAIEGLSQAMAQELPDPMACIPMNPGIIATDMLATAFGDESKQYPTAEEWGKIAAPFILNLGRAQNGQSVTVG